MFFRNLKIGGRRPLAFVIAYLLCLQCLTLGGLAQTNSENNYIFRGDREYFPLSAKVTNQMTNRTINLTTTNTGYNFNVTEHPDQTGTISYENLENAAYSQLEIFPIKSSSDSSVTYSFSVRLSLPSTDTQPVREFSMNGTVEDYGENGFKLDGNLSNPSGTLVEKVKVEVNGQALSPAYKDSLTQTSRTYTPFNRKDQQASFIPAKFTSQNAFAKLGFVKSPVRRPVGPIVIVVGISVGVAIIAGLTCMYLSAHAGPCATRCSTACASNGGVQSYSQGWCGSCTCICRGVTPAGPREGCQVIQQ